MDEKQHGNNDVDYTVEEMIDVPYIGKLVSIISGGGNQLKVRSSII